MSFAARETSRYSGAPFELYLFQSGQYSWRLTSGDKARTYGGYIYSPETIQRTEIDLNQESRSGEIRVTIPRDHEIAGLFRSYIPASPMSLVIYRGHDGEADSEVVANFTGAVAKAEFGESCVLVVVPEADLLRRRIPVQKYQSQCNWILFSHGCGVEKIDHRVIGVLSYVSGETIKSAAFATKPDGYFTSGYVEVGTERRMILAHTGDTLQLIAGIPGAIVGDQATAYAGCSRTSSVCAQKFNNLANFWGFDRIPTRNPFGGLE